MSELDIELQKQTANVSIAEIMQELDTVKKGLQPIANPQTEHNQVGE